MTDSPPILLDIDAADDAGVIVRDEPNFFRLITPKLPMFPEDLRKGLRWIGAFGLLLMTPFLVPLSWRLFAAAIFIGAYPVFVIALFVGISRARLQRRYIFDVIDDVLIVRHVHGRRIGHSVRYRRDRVRGVRRMAGAATVLVDVIDHSLIECPLTSDTRVADEVASRIDDALRRQIAPINPSTPFIAVERKPPTMWTETYGLQKKDFWV